MANKRVPVKISANPSWLDETVILVVASVRLGVLRLLPHFAALHWQLAHHTAINRSGLHWTTVSSLLRRLWHLPVTSWS
jgi:hypothetical protein